MSALTIPPPLVDLSSKTYDVFISYSSKDRDWVLGDLLPKLKAANCKVCVDVEMPKGTLIRDWIERSIRDSRRVIVVITESYLSGNWTGLEGDILYQDDPSGRTSKMIPIRLQPCNMPTFLSRFNYVDMVDETRREADWSSMLNSIREGAGDDFPAAPTAPLPAFDPSVTRRVSEGLTALADLLPTLEAQQAASEFRNTFQDICEQIGPFKELKELHDLFQRLEDVYRVLTNPLRRVAAVNDPDDEAEAWDELEVELPNLETKVDDLMKVAGEASVAGRSPWFRKLEAARKAFVAAVEAEDGAKVAAASRAIRQVLENVPAGLNKDLIAAAKGLSMPGLSASLWSVRCCLQDLTLVGDAAERRRVIDSGAEAVKHINETWVDLLGNHDVLQGLADYLNGAIDELILEDAELFAAEWQNVRSTLKELRGGGTAEDLPKLLVCADKVDALMAAPEASERLRASRFNTFTRQLNLSFNKTDFNLLSLCREMETINNPLARVVEAMGDE